jgi:hypothetical protein
MRINVNNVLLPGVQSERTMTVGKEIHREEIFFNDEYIGTVVYVSRSYRGATTYGWRPEKSAANSALLNKVDAIRKLPRFSQEGGAYTNQPAR